MLPEVELLDTGVFEGGRYFDVTVEYAKASPEDTCVRIATNIYRANEEEFGREAVARHPHVINLAGATNLRELCAALKFCRVVLTNDSGPMHMAGAAGVPVVEVSCHPLSGPIDHPNSPARFGPWGVSARIVQPARHRRRIAGLD